MDISVPLKKLVALFCYSIAPLVPLVLGYYFTNYLLFGRLTVVTFIITGNKDAQDWLIGYFPALHLIGHILFLTVFFGGIKFLVELRSSTALSLTILSAVPFYIGFFIALILSAHLFPGSDQMMMKLLGSFAQVFPFLRVLQLD